MIHQFFGSEEITDSDGFGFDAFGSAIANAGDVNGDGRRDVIILAPRWKDSTGYANVYSGLDGSLLQHLPGEVKRAHYLEVDQVGTLGDVDGDRCDDVFVECYDLSATLVYSGKTGKQLLAGAHASTPLARGVLEGIHTFVGDVNRDGIDDWMQFRQNSVLRVNSGKDNSVLLTFEANRSAPGYYDGAGGAGDINGDGVVDLWVRSDVSDSSKAMETESRTASATSTESRVKNESRPAPTTFPPQRRLRIVSGVDGSELQRVESPWWEFARYGVAGVGDLDGDGRGELVVGFHESNYLGTCGGSVFVLSFPASRR
jgi:hypothetical protein